jgi:hypothetical protein
MLRIELQQPSKLGETGVAGCATAGSLCWNNEFCTTSLKDYCALPATSLTKNSNFNSVAWCRDLFVLHTPVTILLHLEQQHRNLPKITNKKTQYCRICYLERFATTPRPFYPFSSSLTSVFKTYNTKCVQFRSFCQYSLRTKV